MQLKSKELALVLTAKTVSLKLVDLNSIGVHD
jgi:hypothetical protein